MTGFGILLWGFISGNLLDEIVLNCKLVVNNVLIFLRFNVIEFSNITVLKHYTVIILEGVYS